MYISDKKFIYISFVNNYTDGQKHVELLEQGIMNTLCSFTIIFTGQSKDSWMLACHSKDSGSTAIKHKNDH